MGQTTQLPLSRPPMAILRVFLFTATNPDGCITIELTSDGSVGCGSGSFDPLQFCVTCGGPDICAYDWEWTPADYLDNPFSPQPTVTDFDGAPVEYTVSVEPVGLDNCAATGTVLVEPAFEFSASYADPHVKSLTVPLRWTC